MKRFKKIVKDDFVSKTGQEFSIDTSSLTPSTPKIKMKKKTKIAIIISSCVTSLLVAVSVPILMNMFEEEENFELSEKTFTQNQFKLIEEGSFQSLNDVNFPSIKDHSIDRVEPEYISAVSSFATKVYGLIDKTEENMNFSPFGLYSILQLLNTMTDNKTALGEFDELLGLNKEMRQENYVKAFANNFFTSDAGTMQLYNGAFFTNKYEPNPDVIDELTDYYCEAFKLDFQNKKDVKMILEWVDKRVKATGFLKEQDLAIQDNTLLILISTLYFREHWLTTFSPIDTEEATFFGRKERFGIDFMNHEYFGNVYIYDDYFSVYDYYEDGYKIKYIVPKSENDDVLEITKDKNILQEDEEKLWSHAWINLFVPKFSIDYQINFTEILKQAGLNYIFNPYNKALNHAFRFNDDIDHSAYLQYVKQKNKVEFDEQGSEVRSVTMGGVNETTSIGGVTLDSIEVKLDQPFIYVIYDSQDLPIYIGHIDDPR